MQPLLHHAYRALRCPICRAGLEIVGRSLGCQNRHNFDIARTGYVNLATRHRRPPAAGGDTRLQLQRRNAFLATGAFDFITEAIVARSHREGLPQLPLILDAGCGTGYQLSRVARGLTKQIGRRCSGLGIDLSREAALIASRQSRTLAFAVADIWSEWPIRSAVADVLVSVFAPKNFGEMARALRPGGRLIVAYPGPDHLVELRQAFGLMRMGPGKARSYGDQVKPFVSDVTQGRHRRTMQIDRRAAPDLALMGPNAP